MSYSDILESYMIADEGFLDKVKDAGSFLIKKLKGMIDFLIGKIRELIGKLKRNSKKVSKNEIMNKTKAEPKKDMKTKLAERLQNIRAFDIDNFKEALKNKNYLTLKVNTCSALLNDPTQMSKAVQTCLTLLKKYTPEIFEKYKKLSYEERLPRDKWDKRYYTKLVYWFQENFAVERLSYLKEVGRVVHKDTYLQYEKSGNYENPNYDPKETERNFDKVDIKEDDKKELEKILALSEKLSSMIGTVSKSVASTTIGINKLKNALRNMTPEVYDRNSEAYDREITNIENRISDDLISNLKEMSLEYFDASPKYASENLRKNAILCCTNMENVLKLLKETLEILESMGSKDTPENYRKIHAMYIKLIKSQIDTMNDIKPTINNLATLDNMVWVD